MRVAKPLARNNVRIDALRGEIRHDIVGPARGQIDVVGNACPLQRRSDLQIVGVSVDDDLGVLQAL